LKRGGDKLKPESGQELTKRTVLGIKTERNTKERKKKKNTLPKKEGGKKG